jgi:hypothetical protein
MDDRPAWKTVLGFIVPVFLFIRLLYTCSNTSSNSSNLDLKKSFEESQAIMKESLERQKTLERIISTKMLYFDYKALDSLSVLQKLNHGIVKVKKDSLVYIALDGQMKIPKDYYIQNNHDELLRIAFKSPDNLNIFIHDFESKEDIEQSFKQLKSDSNLQKYKVESTIGEVKTLSYKITREDKRYNGYALCLRDDGIHTFYEFESSVLPIDKLKIRAILFLSQNMKEKK